MYRTLDGWRRRPNQWGENAGKLGFVIQLGFCGKITLICASSLPPIDT
jgi:hypothetical protein